MKLRLLVIVAGFTAGSASAAGPLTGHLQTRTSEPRHFARSFQLHVVQEQAADLSVFQRSGMFARTIVAPNMQLGIGLVSGRRSRANALEPRTEVRAKPSRKLGLSFNWRF